MCNYISENVFLWQQYTQNTVSNLFFPGGYITTFNWITKWIIFGKILSNNPLFNHLLFKYCFDCIIWIKSWWNWLTNMHSRYNIDRWWWYGVIIDSSDRICAPPWINSSFICICIKWITITKIIWRFNIIIQWIKIHNSWVLI
jgi:hypothetical protein